VIVVVGNTAEDVFFRVDAFTEPGESRLAEPLGRTLGGKGANQALAAAYHGADTVFVTALGADDAGHRLAAILQQAPFRELRVHRMGATTDVSFIQVAPDGQNVVVSTHACARHLEERHLDHLPLGPGATLLLQANLDLGVTAKLMLDARAAGAYVALNPSPSVSGLPDLLPLADLLVLNEPEAMMLGGGPDALAAARRLTRNGACIVVVTLGPRGARWSQGDVDIEMPTRMVAAVDTTGAGDVFCGVLLAERDAGSDPASSLRAAVDAAAVTTTHVGAHPVTLAQAAMPC